jgi:hypothetical protein
VVLGRELFGAEAVDVHYLTSQSVIMRKKNE